MRSGAACIVVALLVCGGGGGHRSVYGAAPRAEVMHPEPDEAMLQESGSLLVQFQVFDWESGRMRVKVNSTIVADTSEGHAHDMGGTGMEMSWEIFGIQPYHLYTASIEFFDEETGQAVGGAARTTMVLPYYDPVLDPPIPRLVFPVPRDHEDYPSIQGELAVIEAQAQDAAHVRVGQAMVILVNNGVAGFFGRMNHVRTTMDFPEEVCPALPLPLTFSP